MNASNPARNVVTVLVLIGFIAGCAPRERAPLADDPQLDSFAREVGRSLEAHDWQTIVSMADTSHYQNQVVEHGMGEAQYVAELFGLHRVDNNIKRGDLVQWSDLERIASVELQEVTPLNGQRRLLGLVTLDDGSTLDLEARIAEVQGEYALTGGLG